MIGGIELWLILGIVAVLFGGAIIKRVIKQGKEIKKEIEKEDEEEKK